MKLGFTGTQFGMTEIQKRNLYNLMTNPDICPWEPPLLNVFHHGDCVGSDAEAFEIAKELGWRTIAHPCDIENLRAFTASDLVMPVRRPLIRNKIIVESTDVLAAAPLSSEEILRSGTWATIRYARLENKRVVYLL